MKPEEQLRALAERFIALASEKLGVELRYDEASVEWTDGYIERIRANVDESSANEVSKFIGAFLGESIIANYGGRWREDEGTWAVYFSEGNAAFPFAKVLKQYENGGEDSILSFYQMIPIVFEKEMHH
jgi:hypothetical protein